MGIMTVARIFKNLFFFPIESVVITLFLKVLMPATARAKLTYDRNADLSFNKKQIVALGLLMVIGVGSAVGYLTYRYSGTSRSADYTDKQRVEANQSMTAFVLENSTPGRWEEDATVICIVDSAYRGMFEAETDYTVSVYVLDEEAFAAGQAADEDYGMDTLWGYSKSGPGKDPYGSLVKVETWKFTQFEKSGGIGGLEIFPAE